jgi:hypothetical protein
MSTTIIYINPLKEVITENQAVQLKSFKKEFYENSVLKKTEIKFHSGAIWVTYYKDQDETNVLQNLTLEYPNVDDFRVRTRESIGNYFIENEEWFQNGILKFKSSAIRDSKRRMIAAEDFDVITNESKGSGKSFYSEAVYMIWCEPNIEGDWIDKEFNVFNAEYNDDGSLKRIDFNEMSTYDKELYLPNSENTEFDLAILKTKCGFTDEQMNYYLTGAILPIPNFD